MVVVAHLAQVKERDGATMPKRFAHAEASRPKVIDLTGGLTHVRDATLSTTNPEALLRRTMSELRAARFTFDDDRIMASAMMLEFEWIMHTAVEQTLEVMCVHELEPEPWVTAVPVVAIDQGGGQDAEELAKRDMASSRGQGLRKLWRRLKHVGWFALRSGGSNAEQDVELVARGISFSKEG